MTEATEEVAEEVSEQPETIEQVWERTATSPDPITKEDLQTKDEEQEEVLPDRSLVAPEIAKFFEERSKPEQNPVQEELQSLRARLEELAAPKPEEPTEMQQLLAKVAALEERDLQRQEEAAKLADEEANAARLRTYKEGVVGNIRAQDEKYPGLIALSLEENVFYTLYNGLESGQTVSEDDVAQQAEEELWKIYEVLHDIKTKNSKDPEPSQAPKPVTTLTQDLTAVDSPWSLDEAMKRGKKQAQAELWERVQTNQ